MDVYEAIFSRRTVRDFQDSEIDLEVVERILDAGLHAPTNNHLREWEFVIVNDKSARLSLIDRVRKGITEKEVVYGMLVRVQEAAGGSRPCKRSPESARARAWNENFKRSVR
jgi:nitroreductase